MSKIIEIKLKHTLESIERDIVYHVLLHQQDVDITSLTELASTWFDVKNKIEKIKDGNKHE